MTSRSGFILLFKRSRISMARMSKSLKCRLVRLSNQYWWRRFTDPTMADSLT